MSETAPETPVEKPDVKPGAQAEAPASEAPDTEPKTFDAEYVRKLRAEAAKYRNEAKELSTKAKQYDELQESQKSELQKAQEAAAAAEKALEAAKTEALRAKVAASKGIPNSIADRLRGSTQEEMEADADAMMAELNAKFVPKAAPSRDATGAGVAGKAPDYENMSPTELVAAMKARGVSGAARIS